MIKLSLSFLAGALVVASGVFLDSGRATFLTFMLGLLTAGVIVFCFLSSIERINPSLLVEIDHVIQALDFLIAVAFVSHFGNVWANYAQRVLFSGKLIHGGHKQS